MKKIYLSPSSQNENRYAVGNTTEQEQCRKIAAKCVEALKRCGFDAKAGLTGTMYDRVRESNAWKADAHIPIHTNAFDGKVAGFRGFYFSTKSEGYKLLTAIKESVAPITPGTSDGLSAQSGLYEVKNSNAPCAYLELGFHDNAQEAQYIIDHTDDLAKAICKGICKHYGVTYVAPKASTDTGKLYRVQVGAFSKYENAQAMLAKIKAAGFTDAFIKEA